MTYTDDTPVNLNIIGRSVDVIKVYDLPMLGESHIEANQILLRAGQNKFDEADSLLHECIHFIDERFQTGLTERQVYCTAVGLLNLIKDNPGLIKYISCAVNDKKEL